MVGEAVALLVLFVVGSAAAWAIGAAVANRQADQEDARRTRAWSKCARGRG